MGFLCRHYGVSTSGYYAWRARPASARAQANRRLLQRIERIHRRSHGIYGSPRVFQRLHRQGIACGENRVARLMREAGLTGRVVRVTRRAPGVHRFYERNANLRLHAPMPATCNRQWVGDLTRLKFRSATCFLATVMDVYSRKVVGWALGRDRTTALTRRALRHALRHRTLEPGCLFHSDRGVEYGAYDYTHVLHRHGLTPSMSRAYHSQDNAHMESFFHSLKAEWIRGREFHSFTELHDAIKSYMRFYNHHRLHSGIDYHTPEEYERLSP
mgnify:CR=1 FL=1